MSNRKKRKGECTCDCSAYPFPHRFGGGKCTGEHIVSQTWEENWGGGVCELCPHHVEELHGKECQVVMGSESIKECEALINFIEDNEIKTYERNNT